MAAELERLVTETRKMLARVQRKCKRKGIEGYDATDDWLIDLDGVARQFYGLTHQDVVTVVEAIQNTRWGGMAEDTVVVWQGTDARQCTQVLNYLHGRGYRGPTERLIGKPGARALTVCVPPYREEEARRDMAEWAERRKP